MDDREVILVGIDIYGFVKRMYNDRYRDGLPLEMTEDERFAFERGAEGVLEDLELILNESRKCSDEENGYKNIAVHIPGLETATEFSSIDEIIERSETL